MTSGNGYKKIAARLKMPISTARAIIKKFKKFKTIMNQTPGYFLSAATVRRMVREVKQSPKTTVSGFQNLVLYI